MILIVVIIVGIVFGIVVLGVVVGIVVIKYIWLNCDGIKVDLFDE